MEVCADLTHHDGGAAILLLTLLQTHMMGVKNLFTMCTKNRGFLVQTLKPKDMETWLNHFDPLLAGTITSRMGLVQGTPQKATPKKSWKQGW